MSNVVLAKAKTQAEQVTHVNGIKISRHIGGGVYRKGKSRLAFKWRDPAPVGKVKLTMNSATLKNYYAGIFRLHDMKDDPELRAALGNHVKLSPILLDLRGLLNSRKKVPIEQYLNLLKLIQSEAMERRLSNDVIEQSEKVDLPIEIVQDDGVLILQDD